MVRIACFSRTGKIRIVSFYVTGYDADVMQNILL